jgi:hypothetical protein
MPQRRIGRHWGESKRWITLARMGNLPLTRTVPGTGVMTPLISIQNFPPARPGHVSRVRVASARASRSSTRRPIRTAVRLRTTPSRKRVRSSGALGAGASTLNGASVISRIAPRSAGDWVENATSTSSLSHSFGQPPTKRTSAQRIVTKS